MNNVKNYVEKLDNQFDKIAVEKKELSAITVILSDIADSLERIATALEQTQKAEQTTEQTTGAKKE